MDAGDARLVMGRSLEEALDYDDKCMFAGTPERSSRDRGASPWDLKFKQWEHPDWEVTATSESQ